MDTEFVFDMTNGHSAVSFVVDKHRETASVACTFLWTSQNEVDIWVTIGDETLHSVESPGAVCILSCLQHHTLEVGTGIWFGKIHWHSLACRDARNIFFTLFFSTEFIQSVYTWLQRPYVLEACIGCSDEFGSHGKDRVWNVQTVVTAWHRNAPQACLTCSLNVFNRFTGVKHAAVFQVWPFKVYAFRVWLNDVCSDIARDVEHTFVVFDSVLVVNGSVFKSIFVCIVALFEVNNAFHQRMVQVELDLWMVGVIVWHNKESLTPSPSPRRGEFFLSLLYSCLL